MNKSLAVLRVEDIQDRVFCMDAETFLRSVPAGSVNCIVTSPPYYGLRDYGVEGQIGLENTPERYVKRMVELFRLARRALRDDGVLWLNLGDSYSSGGRTTQTQPTLRPGQVGVAQRAPVCEGIKPKDLIGIPWRVALTLQADGWYLRSDVIWAKPNPMPESVTDRPTKAHEYVFLLTKNEKYWYDAEAIKERAIEGNDLGLLRGRQTGANDLVAWHAPSIKKRQDAGVDSHEAGNGYRNKRTVWTVATKPTPFAHFATFPQALIEPMILAGCPATVCAACGAPYERVIEREAMVIRRSERREIMGEQGRTQSSGTMVSPARATTLGFVPACDCHADTRPGLCLDMFMGSGTTAIVARRLGRSFTGCDLNRDYVSIALQRIPHAWQPGLL